MIVTPDIDGHDLRTVREALVNRPANEPLDSILSGPGGSLPTAFKIARDIRRHVSDLTTFVPRPMKSAMTLLALAGDELVMGDFREVGPLDSIACEHLCAAFPLERATLERFATLNEIENLERIEVPEVATAEADDVRPAGVEAA